MVGTRDDGYLEDLLKGLMDSGMKLGEEFVREPHPMICLDEMNEVDGMLLHSSPRIVWQDISFVMRTRDGETVRTNWTRVFARHPDNREVTLSMKEIIDGSG